MLLKFLFAIVARADDAVNLSDLGMDGFTPYLTERHQGWIALPAGAIVLLLIHLKRNRKKRNLGGNS